MDDENKLVANINVTLTALIVLLCIFFLGFSKAKAVVIKSGVMQTTPVSLVSEWHIDDGTQEGEHFSARVVEDLVSPLGEVIIPRNSRVVGRVENIVDPKSFHRDAQVDILFEKIVFPDNVQSIDIAADGNLTPDKFKKLKISAQAAKQTVIGASLGAITGFKFGGLLASSSSYGTNVMIGAAAGGALALVSFMAQPGKPLEVYPGLPMTLNIISLEEQDYKYQALTLETSEVEATVNKASRDEISVLIENNKDFAIPLNNLKIVDGLGYTSHPIQEFKYFDKNIIPAHSSQEYKIKFQAREQLQKQWLVLTDSFNKQEYFRVEF